MKPLSLAQRETLIDKLEQDQVQACLDNEAYLRSLVRDYLAFNQCSDDELLQRHKEAFDEDFK